jgi:deoxyadenosine/deoxycytidine kinase
VLEIDHYIYLYAKKEMHKYLRLLRINKKLEVSIYNAAYLYYRQLYIAYTQYIIQANCNKNLVQNVIL